MKKWIAVTLAAILVGTILVFCLVWRREAVAVASRALFEPSVSRDRGDRAGLEASSGPEGARVPVTSAHTPTPVDPSDERELADYVEWMRSLGHDELLRLSNADFEFKESEIVEKLQQLQGQWVVSALGDLAIAERDPLLKAILVKGLVGRTDFERLDDQRLIPILDQLVGTLRLASEDPYQVASDLATAAYGACSRGDQDYVLLMSGHLSTSDNGDLLIHGYLYMGILPGGEGVLMQALAGHENADGRLGALEGLRKAGTRGNLSGAEITTLSLAALESESSARNRLLLYEMMTSAGGEDGLAAVEQILRSGKVTEIDKTVGFLAVHMESRRAQALFEDLLRDHELDAGAKQATYNAMGLLQGEEGQAFLLGLVRNDELDGAERLAGLRGLWNRPVDERLAGELRSVLDTGKDGSLRTEALRMLVYGESEGSGIDLRELAALDDDPTVRAEAVQLAAMQPSEDAREWLEERLFQDRSFDVKAAALGALVYQAHYTGDGDRVLGYLERARKFTDDEQALAMIAEGERMVKAFDPRNLDLRLDEEAKFLGTVAKYTEGPAARSFQRQAKQLAQIVASLRATRDGRRPAR